MTNPTTILHILRNPYDASEREQREARLAAADLIERLQEANEDWLAYAKEHGVDYVPR